MSNVDHALEAVRRVVKRLGVDEVSKKSGVPITTLYDAKRRDFMARPIETFQKLAAFAEDYEREHGQGAAPGERDAAA